MLKRNTNLILKTVLIILLVILIALIVALAKQVDNNKVAAANNTRNYTVETARLYSELEYAIYYDPEPTEELLSKVRAAIATLEGVDKTTYDCEATIKISNELARLKELENKVASDLNHYLTWEKEYYYAAKVWEYLMQRGYGEVVTSAIIGNMMIETSGGSLKLEPTIYSPSGNFYGLCQWSQKYYPETKDLPFEHQLDYLVGSMPWEFNTFGWIYKDNFKYDDFLKVADVEEAALAFAMSYERCGSVSYQMRQQAAIKAYNYFNLNK
jgi:hypothetical protein